jgi:DNA-binding MarR family transcriptional regulator
MSSSVENQDQAALAETLRPALLRVSRKLRQEAQRVGASALDALLLVHILKNPGVGVSELAEAEHMSKPSMSGHVKRLEAAGWITRAGNAEDGRRSGLAITDEGHQQLHAIRQHRNDWLAARLALLSPDAREKLEDAIEPLLQLVSLDP